MLRLGIAVLVVGLFTLAPTMRASACSGPPPCGTPASHPATTTLPANVGGIWLDDGIFGSGDVVVTPSLRLTPPGAATIDVAFTEVDRSLPPFPRVQVRFDATLPVGATLAFDATTSCSFGQGTSARSWTIVEAVPKPSALGTLSVTVAHADAPVAGGAGCYDNLPTVTAHVALTWDPSAQPWSDFMVFETVVDGVVWNPRVSLNPFGFLVAIPFGGSRVGRGEDEIFAQCGLHMEGVAEGHHVVLLRGVLPDGTVVESDAVEVDLRCESVGRVGGCSAIGSMASGRPWFVILFVTAGCAFVRRRHGARRPT